MEPLHTAVLRTLTWFDLFQYPLTPFECWRYLWVEGALLPPVTVREVEQVLHALATRGLLREEQGMWSRADSKVGTTQRLSAARVAVAKRRRALKAARLLRHLPFIRFVGLGNTLALGVARPGSDIDLLIVLAHGRLYLGRLIVTAVLHAVGWRRHGQHVANRLCLSFYLDDENLNLAPLAQVDDPYLTYWAATLVPLVGSATYANFLTSNTWVRERLPHARQPHDVAAARTCFVRACEPSSWSLALELVLNMLVTWWAEPLSRSFQIKRIHKHQHTRLGDGTTAVVVAGGVLKFHESDRRQELAATYRRRLAERTEPVL